MTRIRFEDLPSKNTPINADSLNKLNNVVISSSEPTTGEEVWIKKGNNLIDLSLFETKTVNDVTFANNGNGTITINGTANGAFGISFIKLFLKAGNYSFNSNSNENMYLYDYNTNTNILSSGGNATFNQDYNNVGLDMYIEQGTVFSNVLVSPMLNMGSQLPFEKYIDKKIYVQNDNGVYEEFSKEEDTGWVDMTSYINGGFAARDGAHPMARRIGNKVYWKGAVYCTSNYYGSLVVPIMSNLPIWCVPPNEISGGSIQYDKGTPYMIFIDANRNINVYSQSEIVATSMYNGYALSNIGGYLVD